jgi:hypothetical protein
MIKGGARSLHLASASEHAGKANGAKSDGQLAGAPEEIRGEIYLRDVPQYPLPKRQRGEILTVATARNLLLRRAVDIVEQEGRKTMLRCTPEIRRGAQFHGISPSLLAGRAVTVTRRGP